MERSAEKTGYYFGDWLQKEIDHKQESGKIDKHLHGVICHAKQAEKACNTKEKDAKYKQEDRKD